MVTILYISAISVLLLPFYIMLELLPVGDDVACLKESVVNTFIPLQDTNDSSANGENVLNYVFSDMSDNAVNNNYNRAMTLHVGRVTVSSQNTLCMLKTVLDAVVYAIECYLRSLHL